MMELSTFNTLDAGRAAALVRPCLDIDRWVLAIVAGRPYASVDDVAQRARTAADPFTDDEVDAALAHHPRIGERATGDTTEAAHSRSEQAGLGIGDAVQQRLIEANRAYEERFGQVFLIRAAGRSAEEILAALAERMGHDEDTERLVVADQLRQIAVLRLQGALS